MRPDGIVGCVKPYANWCMGFIGLMGVVQSLAVIELRVLCMPVGAHMAIHIHQVGAGPHECNVDSVTLLINCFIVVSVDTHIDMLAPMRWLDLPRWNPKYMTKIISIKNESLDFQSWHTFFFLPANTTDSSLLFGKSIYSILISSIVESERYIVIRVKKTLISGFLKRCFVTMSIVKNTI